MLRRTGQLFEIEADVRNQSPEASKSQRKLRATTLLESLHGWFGNMLATVLKKSEFANAIRYSLACWAALMCYCNDGAIEMDNHIAERALRARCGVCQDL